MNFATASEQASQQNNYAIPSYRVYRERAGDSRDDIFLNVCLQVSVVDMLEGASARALCSANNDKKREIHFFFGRSGRMIPEKTQKNMCENNLLWP